MVIRRKQTGFTLIEVMVSVGILGVIMVLIWSSTSQSLRSKDRTEARDLLFHSGQVALKKIADDIAVAFLTSAASPAPQATAPATQQGAEADYQTFFIGEDRGDTDSVRFTSLSHMRLMRGAKESDQTRIAYEVVPNPDERNFYNLTRREEPWLTNSTEVEGRAFTLVEKIKKFDLEYYDDRKNDWSKEWSTEKVDWKGRLPMAVRITIVFTDPDFEDVEIPIVTSVMPALWASPISL